MTSESDLEENNVLEHCLDMMKANNDEMSAKEMKEALAAIAQEVQRFRSADTSEDVLSEDIDVYKTKLRVKRKQIRSLKDNLNTACTIAKTVLSAKENECQSLNNHLTMIKNESADLVKKNAERNEVVQRLTMENHLLSEKLESLHTFIELGYNELQKIRNSEVNDLPIVMQLKEIMVSCGQYYADYCNEHEKCAQLEQKNRYLTNKLHILETNLEASTDELKKAHRTPRTAEKKSKNEARKIGYACSEYKFGTDVNVSRVSLNSIDSSHKDRSRKQGSTFVGREESLDLSSHMSLVKNLLTDQDTMLKDLKKLTEELSSV